MSVFRRLFDGAYREAKRAEGKGRYRQAAAAYAEADMPDEASRVLLVLAARTASTEEKVLALRDALHHMVADHPRRIDVEIRIGKSLLEEAQAHGVRTLEERRRAEESAILLERGERWSEAATAFELLGRPEDVARCLEAGGEIERLEELLESRGREADDERLIRKAVREYEMAMETGARLEARAALRRATETAPGDRSLRDLLRRLETGLPTPRQLRLNVGGTSRVYVASRTLVLGREGLVALRGASLSRAHAELSLREGAVVVRDLGSRNGTLVGGVPIAGELRAEGHVEVGLGEDVTLRVRPDGSALYLEVTRGLDRGLQILAGEGILRPRDAPFHVDFEEGQGRVTGIGRVELNERPIAAPIVCLAGDVLVIDGCRIEVE